MGRKKAYPDDVQKYVRIARSPYTSVETLFELAGNPFYGIRESVALNPITPPEVLAFMAKNEPKLGHGPAQTAVASNTKTPPESLARLAGVFKVGGKLIGVPANGLTRYAVARNPSAPFWLIKFMLSQDSGLRHESSLVIAEDTRITPEMGAKLVKARDYNVRARVAGNLSLPTGLAEELSFDKYDTVRAAVAGRKDISSETLERLSDTDDFDILLAVAGNPNTSSDVLLRMMDSYDHEFIQQAIKANPSYAAYRRGLLLVDLEIDEGLLASDLLDEVWRYGDEDE